VTYEVSGQEQEQAAVIGRRERPEAIPALIDWIDREVYAVPADRWDGYLDAPDGPRPPVSFAATLEST
jgi:hypothetical protein